MILPATPEETAELESDVRRQRLRSVGLVVAVVVAAVGLVLVIERPDGGDADVAAATSADPVPTGGSDTVVSTPDAASPETASPDTVAPPTVDGPAPVTLQGVGADTVDAVGRFVDGHVVVRFSLEGSGILTFVDGSGTVLDGGTIVVEGDGPRTGGVVVPAVAAASSLNVETDGAWEVTALPTAALPPLPVGGTIETAGTASFALTGSEQLVIAVDGACGDDLVDVELYSVTASLASTQVVGEGTVPVLQDATAVTVRSPCSWLVSG